MALLDLIVTKRGLAAALHSGEPAYGDLAGYLEARLVPPLESLMQAAEGETEMELSGNELLRAVALLCGLATSGDIAQTRRMVSLLLIGPRNHACSAEETIRS